mmetsp:Transcript_32074/g.75257  ORF Transcript_32074/g.75257 Transcript_32074/m.75257 type:complete len:550 (-) Transcript_32074:76-1725(-)
MASDWASAALTRHGIPSADTGLLHKLFMEWGEARAPQILGLWTFLGSGPDGGRPVAAPAVQLWGPAGGGKTSLLRSFLQAVKLPNIWLNCACFSSVGELHARLIEVARREADKIAKAAVASGCQAAEGSSSMLNPVTGLGHAPRALDRLERGLQGPLEVIARCQTESANPAPLIVVLDHAQELPKFGASVLANIVGLPALLQSKNQLIMVTVSRLPLSQLGLSDIREPPALAFPPYTDSQAEQVCLSAISSSTPLLRRQPIRAKRSAPLRLSLAAPQALPYFARVLSASESSRLATTCSGCYQAVHELRCHVLRNTSFMKLASHALGRDVNLLVGVASEVLCNWQRLRFDAGCGNLQRIIEHASKRRLSLCEIGDSSSRKRAAAASIATEVGKEYADATVRSLTVLEKRLLVACFLASYIPKDEDCQLFLPMGLRKKRRLLKRNSSAASTALAAGEAMSKIPVQARLPQNSPLSRVLAIHCKVTNQAQAYSPELLQALVHLRDVGLIKLLGERMACERDCKILSCTRPPLARKCAAELGIDLAEFLVAR